MHVTVEIEGINLEKLLRAAADGGLVVTHAQRCGPRRMRLRVRAYQMKRMQALCARFGWELREVRAGSLVRAARFLRRRALLAPSLALGALLVWLSSQMILAVRIDNAHESIAEVRRVLEDAGVRPGRLKAAFSIDELRARLALRLPGLSFVGLRYAGSTLVCDCRSATLGEQADVPGEGQDIVAAQPGIITRISASSGTPLVTPGQAVVKGQVLIRGVERTQKGELRAVRAQGQVSARVYAKGEAKVSLTETTTVETGQTRTRVTVHTPWHERVVRDAQPFDTQDVSRERQVVVGLYLPLWREIETYAQTEVFSSPRDKGDAASMAQGAAEKIAKDQCPYDALILDKWVNYSMIDNEFVYATVVLEYETAIAGRTK
ncbi:MAG: sporulation protein YqfD [Candidatus Ventricola sp.]